MISFFEIEDDHKSIKYAQRKTTIREREFTAHY